jgi:hypothetical protein
MRGNHGEDVKEYYFYLDSTPTHSYMKYLYKYPHAAFPYSQLLDENRHRGKDQPEFELLDTGVFEQDRYFDVFVEYAKGDVEDILMKITVANRGPETARLRLLPTIWFRNTWGGGSVRPHLRQVPGAIELDHPGLANAGSIMTARRNCSSPKTKPMSNACSDWKTATRA